MTSKSMGKTVAIIQARMGSTRLPGKVLMDVNGVPAIQHVLTRTARAKHVDEVWLACSNLDGDDPLAEFAEKIGFPVFRGDEKDVLSRYVAAAAESNADTIVRITGDCPMIDPGVIDLVLDRFAAGDVDYVSNIVERSYPDGLDVEAFSRDALDTAGREAQDDILREHVTPYIRGVLGDRYPRGDFRIASVTNGADFGHLRWTLDEPEDLLFLRRLMGALPEDFDWHDAVAELTRNPDALWINRKHVTETKRYPAAFENAVRRDQFDKSNQLFARALETIPLAAQTFSKSHQQWSRGATPLFFESGQGCYVRDIDGNIYIDYLQGLMPNILGYCDPDVDAAVRDQLERGVSFSLSTTLEMELAERLVRDIPCAEMVRYGKNGSDVTTAAIRLARAHTGRDKILVAGYHGWHDWYIGSTQRKLGVPEDVRSLTTSFPFNDADRLREIVEADANAFAAIILEPTGAVPVEPGFLESVREIASAFEIVLIFDEIITGFRIHTGGAQAYLGVTPDLACFGKAMANGLPISAVVGRRDIMQLMEDVFVSGTFGGETLSIAAAIATIDKLASENVVERLWKRGSSLIEASNRVIDQCGMGSVLSFGADGWWPRLAVSESPIDNVLLMTLMRQAFVAEGLFLATSYNLCLPHDNDVVMDATIEGLKRAMTRLREEIDSPDPHAHLRGELIQPTFSVR